MNQDHQAFASAVLCPRVISPLRPPQPAAPQGMLLLSPPEGGTQGQRVRVLPGSCRWGRAAYATTIIAIPGPTGQAVPPKGPKNRWRDVQGRPAEGLNT